MSRRFITIAVLWFLVNIYFFQAIKTVFPDQRVWLAYWLYEGVLFGLVLFTILTVRRTVNTSRVVFGFFSLMLISFAPKMVAIPILLVEDLYRLLTTGAHLFGIGQTTSAGLAGRSRLVSEFAIGIAALPFFSLIYGMVNGKYNYRLHKLTLKFADLPEAFDGFTITQLSDIHSGSFDNKPAVEKGIALANAQNSDLILFTGDLVNNTATEMNDYIDSFSKLKARYGKFSVLGNHDYGDYVKWETPEEKVANLDALKAVHPKIGFKLLLNESVQIEKDGQHITLTGVENWGKGSFVKHGNLTKATAGVNDTEFKILMSHDPSHWKAEILAFPKHINLTLAGHTHGMQFGVELPFFKWSPVKYIYPEWAGIYSENDKYINVNRGFGFLGYPGRFGILPEITVITLVKG